MSGNLTKSEAGWVRLRENVASRRGVRGAKLDARVQTRREAPKPISQDEVKIAKVTGESPDFIVRKGRTRRRVVIGR